MLSTIKACLLFGQALFQTKHLRLAQLGKDILLILLGMLKLFRCFLFKRTSFVKPLLKLMRTFIKIAQLGLGVAGFLNLVVQVFLITGQRIHSRDKLIELFLIGKVGLRLLNARPHPIFQTRFSGAQVGHAVGTLGRARHQGMDFGIYLRQSLSRRCSRTRSGGEQMGSNLVMAFQVEQLV